MSETPKPKETYTIDTKDNLGPATVTIEKDPKGGPGTVVKVERPKKKSK